MNRHFHNFVSAAECLTNQFIIESEAVGLNRNRIAQRFDEGLVAAFVICIFLAIKKIGGPNNHMVSHVVGEKGVAFLIKEAGAFFEKPGAHHKLGPVL
mgnify:CR=1 FL=1